MTITRMQEPRQLYGLGSLVKKITKPIKKIIKSDLGKAALIGAAAFGIPGTQFGGLLGRASLGGAAPSIFGKTGGIQALLPSVFGTPGVPDAIGKQGFFQGLKTKFGNLGMGTKLGIAGGLATYLGSQGLEEQDIEEIKQDPSKLRIYLKDYFSKLNPNAPDEEVEQFVETNVSEYKATGGRVGFSEGGDYEAEFMKLVGEFMERGFSQQEAIEEARDTLEKKSMATGGRVGFKEGKNMKMASAPDLEDSRNDMANQMFGKDLRLLTEEELEMLEDEIDRLSIKFMAKGGMPTGIMRTNQAGTMERDYRETGGFVPVGIKEKADDVPAMLSKNEFVMTADAVRGAGNGSIEKGAQRMYDQMKRLENKVA